MPYKDPVARREYARKYYSVYMKSEKMRAWGAAYKRKQRAEDPEKYRQQAAAYRQANPDKMKAGYSRSYAKIKADPERHAKKLERGRSYRQRYPDRVSAGWARWRERNAEQLRELWRVWAIKRRHASGECTLEQWQARMAYYGYCCAYCHKDLTNAKYEMDHVIPIKKGGTNWASNFVPACPSCNRKKQCNRWNPRPVAVKETLYG